MGKTAYTQGHENFQHWKHCSSYHHKGNLLLSLWETQSNDLFVEIFYHSVHPKLKFGLIFFYLKNNHLVASKGIYTVLKQEFL